MSLSRKAELRIQRYLELPDDSSLEIIAKEIYHSKYGTATTHMNKLILRILRGVGNPCPCILIGIGKDRLINDLNGVRDI